MNMFLNIIFALIIRIMLAQGEITAVDGECIAVNKLLRAEQSNNCCLIEGITCENGHITIM